MKNEPNLLERVVEFLRRNPDESLTKADAAAKFGRSIRTADKQLTLGCKQGQLKRVCEHSGPGCQSEYMLP